MSANSTAATTRPHPINETSLTMTTTLLPQTTTTDRPRAITALPFTTLLRVELRKATDTRSGRALLATIVGLSALSLGWSLAHPADGVSFSDYGGGVAAVVAFLAPIIGLLAMTAEWTQRTALTTFTLAPRRSRVLAAKFSASMLLAMTTLAIGVALTFLATAIGSAVHGGDAVWAGVGGELRSYVIIVAAQVIMATAFGALAAQTTVAIGAFLAAPVVWAKVSEPLLGKAAPWFDVFSAYDHLSSGHPLDHIGQTLTAVTIWVVVPATIGIARSMRREVK
jgi:hypothetical protein